MRKELRILINSVVSSAGVLSCSISMAVLGPKYVIRIIVQLFILEGVKMKGKSKY